MCFFHVSRHRKGGVDFVSLGMIVCSVPVPTPRLTKTNTNVTVAEVVIKDNFITASTKLYTCKQYANRCKKS